MTNESIDAKDLLEAISSNPGNKFKYTKRRVVFIICPDPFENPQKQMEYLKYGFRAAADAGRKQESPLLCYSFKLGMYGFTQFTNRVGPFHEKELFDMQVSQMLRCNYIAVYGNEYTESMQRLIDVASVSIPRIEFRTI